ncbi:hypothetical protein ACLESO_27690, partial [Pyxidicoccus sp. 3LG]
MSMALCSKASAVGGVSTAAISCSVRVRDASSLSSSRSAFSSDTFSRGKALSISRATSASLVPGASFALSLASSAPIAAASGKRWSGSAA